MGVPSKPGSASVMRKKLLTRNENTPAKILPAVYFDNDAWVTSVLSVDVLGQMWLLAR